LNQKVITLKYLWHLIRSQKPILKWFYLLTEVGLAQAPTTIGLHSLTLFWSFWAKTVPIAACSWN